LTAPVLSTIALLASPVVEGAEVDRMGCQAWLDQTVAKIERLPEKKWRDAILGEAAHACSAIPEPLRKAALDLRGRKPERERVQLLAQAARVALGPSCPIPDPLADSRALATACPLPKRPELELSDVVLGDIRAVDYAVLNAMARGLIAAKAYEASAQRLMMDFTLSSALLGEQARKRKRNNQER
jgi:hypothetical protein